MLETRSSDSITATLKDYALGSFESCGPAKATKYHDLNANGSQDAGEPFLSGWTIFIDKNGNETLDAGETSQVTDAHGDADFANLQPGTYSFCEVLQPNWINSDPDAGTLCKSANVVAGGTPTQVKFGNYQNATKSGYKWRDDNGNGTQDAGEPRLSGWTISLTGTDGFGNPVSLTDVTDANGDYSFTVTPGSYTVCETLQTGWQQTYPSSGADCGGSTGYSITLTSQQVDSDNNFGNRQLFKLIVITCDTVTEELVDSTVTLNGVTTQTITTPPAGITEAQLCGLGGASYDNLLAGTYNPSVELPDLPPLFP
jgi:hypothetical protein